MVGVVLTLGWLTVVAPEFAMAGALEQEVRLDSAMINAERVSKRGSERVGICTPSAHFGCFAAPVSCSKTGAQVFFLTTSG
jgi:hypothetical protein